MAKAFLGIGSNVADAAYRIGMALELLRQAPCRITRKSDIYQVSSPYYNLVAEIDTEMSYPDLLAFTKNLEMHLGRLPHLKGDKVVPIDVDIVIYDNRVIRPSDLIADYFSLGYKQIEAVFTKNM